MSLDLKDFRGRITPETHWVLESRSQVTGRDKHEIVRDVLHAWATEQLRIASIARGYLRAEGLEGIDGGASRNVRECEGARP